MYVSIIANGKFRIEPIESAEKISNSLIIVKQKDTVLAVRPQKTNTTVRILTAQGALLAEELLGSNPNSNDEALDNTYLLDEGETLASQKYPDLVATAKIKIFSSHLDEFKKSPLNAQRYFDIRGIKDSRCNFEVYFRELVSTLNRLNYR